jgi:hypothetical protein
MMMRQFCLLLCGYLLCGCTGLENWDKRYGPDPSLPSKAIVASVDHQQEIMKKLYELTDCSEGENTVECNYQVTVAGFNFIDEQCDAYLRELFILDKERDRAKVFLGSADKLTSAILASSPASKATMEIVAQAFGFGSNYLSVSTDSYLYKTKSGNILHVVSELQSAYRNQTFTNKILLVAEPDVYSHIRGYLKVCMPPTIESKIEEVVSASVSRPARADTGPGTNQNVSLILPIN